MNIHGNATFSWKNNILYVETFGPFNEEGAKKVATDYLTSILNRSVVDFSVIEKWDEYSLASPKAMSNIGKSWEQLTNNGCTSIAVILCSDIQRRVATSYLPPTGKIFCNEEDAEFWIVNRNRA